MSLAQSWSTPETIDKPLVFCRRFGTNELTVFFLWETQLGQIVISFTREAFRDSFESALYEISTRGRFAGIFKSFSDYKDRAEAIENEAKRMGVGRVSIFRCSMVPLSTGPLC